MVVEGDRCQTNVCTGKEWRSTRATGVPVGQNLTRNERGQITRAHAFRGSNIWCGRWATHVGLPVMGFDSSQDGGRTCEVRIMGYVELYKRRTTGCDETFPQVHAVQLPGSKRGGLETIKPLQSLVLGEVDESLLRGVSQNGFSPRTAALPVLHFFQTAILYWTC